MIPDLGKGSEGNSQTIFRKDLGNFLGDAFHKREGGIHSDRREGGIRRRRGQVEGLSLLKSPSNLLGRIAIKPKDLAEMVKLKV